MGMGMGGRRRGDAKDFGVHKIAQTQSKLFAEVCGGGLQWRVVATLFKGEFGGGSGGELEMPFSHAHRSRRIVERKVIFYQ